MKKINSIGYGDKILGCAAVFTLVIPVVIQAALFVHKSQILSICMKTSFGIGIFISLFFVGLLTIELHQDKRMNMYYEARKKEKLHLGNGLYECQACGNRILKSDDKNCGVCGILFEGKGK